MNWFTELVVAVGTAIVLAVSGPAIAEPAPVAPVELVAPVVANVDFPEDAYASYDAKGLYPDSDVPLVLDYVETVEGERPDVATVYGYFVVESVSTPGMFHVMRYSVLHFA